MPHSNRTTIIQKIASRCPYEIQYIAWVAVAVYIKKIVVGSGKIVTRQEIEGYIEQVLFINSFFNVHI